MKTPAELSRTPLQSADEHIKRSRQLGRVATALRTAIRTEDWSEQEAEVLLRSAAHVEALATNYKKSSALKTQDNARREVRAKEITAALLAAPFFAQPDLASRICLVRHINPALQDVNPVTDARSARYLTDVIFRDALRELADHLARDSGLPPAAAIAGFKEHFLANRSKLDAATHNVLVRTREFLVGDPLAD